MMRDDAMISAHTFAHQYRTYLHAQLSGDEIESIDFGLWLDEHWLETPELLDEPCLDDVNGNAPPDSSVTWIEHDGHVVGMLAGRSRGCFRIPVTATPPVIALYLDDASDCTTGSVHQERALVFRTEAKLDGPLPVAPHPSAGRASEVPNAPILPLGIPPAAIASELRASSTG
jgi:hypothetical protein